MFIIGYSQYEDKDNSQESCVKKTDFEIRKHFFTIRAATDWNSLSREVVTSKTTSEIKKNLKENGFIIYETNLMKKKYTMS